MIYKQYLQSPAGALEIQANESNIIRVFFTDENSPSDHSNPVTRNAKQQLQAYFDGQLKTFDLPLEPEGTTFQKTIWHHLQQIPFGQSLSYSDVGKIAGHSKAVRAIGVANSRNPICIIIPCHRVIGRDGRLTGYSGGLHRKAWLLEHEQVAFKFA
jgi:methylated-DNA-[protein]-cysteine S-methyltransferase